MPTNPYYPSVPASDGTNNVGLAGAMFQVFEIEDTNRTTPLPLLSTSGLPIAVYETTSMGVLPPVHVVSPNMSHIFKSGEWEWRRDSFDGAQEAVFEARDAAAAAAERAAQDAQTAVDAIGSMLPRTAAGDVLAAEVLTPETNLRAAVETVARNIGGGGGAPDDTAGSALYRVENLYPRPNSAAASDWFNNGFGTDGAGTSAIQIGGGHKGRNSFNLKWTTPATGTGTNTGPQITTQGRAVIEPGKPVNGSLFIEAVDTPGDVQVWLRLIFRDAANALVGEHGGAVQTIRKGEGPQRALTPIVKAPTNAVRAHVTVTVWTSSMVGTGTLKFSCPQIEQTRAAGPYRDGDFPDSKWVGTKGDSASVGVLTEAGRLAAFGDSHFGQADGGGYTLPDLVAKLIGREVVNSGRGGEPSTGIAIRAGVTPLIVAGGTIPATTTAVSVSATPTQTHRTDSGAWPYVGELAGIGGSLIQQGGKWTFTRSHAGAETVIPPDTTFIPYGTATAADVWLWCGGNNLANYDVVMRDVESFVAACKAAGRQFLLVSLYNNGLEPQGSDGYSTILRINREWKRRWPQNYVEAREYLIANGLALVGKVATTADLQAISEDRIPPSLLADNVHLSPDAREMVVAPLLVQTMRRRGMIPS